MAPIIQIDESVLGTLNPDVYTRRSDLEKTDLEERYVKLPSGIWVEKQRNLFNLIHDQTEAELNAQGNLFITPNEFREFLQYTRDNHPEIYKEITEVRGPWRAERIGAKFSQENGKMHITTRNGKEELDPNTLMEDRYFSLEAWLSEEKYVTSQGFPNKNILEGNTYFWHPRDGAVARFVAFSVRAVLGCDGDPSVRGSDLGVRAAKQRE